MSGPQDTGKFRKKTLDQFYTQPVIAAQCIHRIRSMIDVSGLTWVEPAAGAGAFLADVPDPIAIDIEPTDALDPRISQADFMTWTPAATAMTSLLFYGNPPFGRQATLAKAFIQRAASFPNTKAIAFILPRSFQKPSMQRAIPPRFHCASSEELPLNSFQVNGTPHNVPCVFQIWVRRETDRPRSAQEVPVGFTYVKQADTHHLIIRRVGVYAGAGYLPSTEPRSAQSHYFIELEPEHRSRAAAIASALTIHTFPSNTTGPRSLSKGEITEVLNNLLAEDTPP
jgi:hypothetical protein